MQPKVSILVPCYNSEKHLAATIQSALRQSWRDKEIIVVNDGSTDRTGEVAEQFRSDNVKVYHQPNAGACRARNFAFEKSTGEFIQYLDADDLLSHNKIEEQLKYLLVSKDAVASGPWAHFTNQAESAIFHDQYIYKDYASPADLLLDMWERREMMQTSVWLTPRHIVEKAGGWDESLTINQDGEFFCRVLLAASKVKYCPQAKVYYRSGNPNSVSKSQAYSKTKAESLLRTYLSYENQIMRIANTGNLLRIRQAIAKNYYSYIYLFYNLYPDLARVAVDKVKQWRIPPDNQVGGVKFARLAGIVGFYNALRLRKLINKM